MATSYEAAEERGPRQTKRGGSGKSSLASGLSTAAMLDIVDRLGLVDLAVERVKSRLEEVDVDDLIDEVGDYLKRNPEVLVVSLGAVTIAAGALVYLNKRNESGSKRTASVRVADDEDDDDRPSASKRPRPKSGSR